MYLLLSLCSNSLRQYSQALSFSSCSPVFVPCRLEGNSLEKLSKDGVLWCFGCFAAGCGWSLAPVSSGSRGKLTGVWGLDPLSLDNESLSTLSRELAKVGDWDRDWLPVSCGEERDKGIIKPVEEWDPMEMLSMLDWLWLRVSWDGDSDKWIDWLRFSIEPEFEAVVKINGEWPLLGEAETAAVLVNVRCWSQGRSMEKLWMFRTWSGK